MGPVFRLATLHLGLLGQRGGHHLLKLRLGTDVFSERIKRGLLRLPQPVRRPPLGEPRLLLGHAQGCRPTARPAGEGRVRFGCSGRIVWGRSTTKCIAGRRCTCFCSFLLYFFIWCSLPGRVCVLHCVLLICDGLVSGPIHDGYERPSVCSPICCKLCSLQMGKSVTNLLYRQTAFSGRRGVARDETTGGNRHLPQPVVPLDRLVVRLEEKIHGHLAHRWRELRPNRALEEHSVHPDITAPRAHYRWASAKYCRTVPASRTNLLRVIGGVPLRRTSGPRPGFRAHLMRYRPARRTAGISRENSV